MKAIVVAPGSESPQLRWENVPDIGFGDEEVLVDIRASAVNRADLLQARGLYPPPPGAPETLGLEMSGVVLKTGNRVTTWKTGDRVCALLSGGGYAERAAVHADMLMKLPDDWSFVDGAAIPEVWLTAFVNLYREGELKTGETVLIHAGGSGVGTAAVQLARESGSVVYVTAGTDAKVDRCRDLGAAAGFNYRTLDFETGLLKETGGSGVDLVLDPIGGPYLERNLKVLKEHGRLVIIGTMGGAGASINLGAVIGKSLCIKGSRLRGRPLDEKIGITRAFVERFQAGLEAGRLVPVVDRVFPINEAEQAHQYVREDRNIGKVVLEVPEEK